MTRKTQSSQYIDLFVGSRIRFFRIQRNWSQQDLAKQLGITYQQLHKYESGSNSASASRLADIGTCLGIHVSDLFHGIEPTEVASKELPRSFSVPMMDKEEAILLSYLARIPEQKRDSLHSVMLALADQ